ncbi:MAG: xylulokinase [Micrococcaceae bacterium]
MKYILGIDLGTSSLKGLLMDPAGQVVASASSDYPTLNSKPGYSEQHPESWLTACQKVLEELRETISDFTQNLEAISFSGQMHSVVVLDENYEVLRPAILWNDTRTTHQCQEIMDNFGTSLLDITKNIALEGFTLPKILWLQENEPDTWSKVRHIMLPKDYLGYWLTGQIQTDLSDAAGTLLLDTVQKRWSKEILAKFSIPLSYLPALLNSEDLRGTLKETIKNDLGFKKDVKVFAGAADNACAAIGAGIIDNNSALASIGTSGVFLAFEESGNQSYQGNLHLFNHVLPDASYSMGVTLAAGNSLNWFKKTFAPYLTFEELLSDIDTIAPGANGLLFTPYIVGERTPHVDSQVRGSFIGIGINHTIKHFARSVLEGITFSLKDSQTLMEQVTKKSFKKIISVGGGAKNETWLQIQADIFNSEIICLTAEQGPALGAAMIAAVGNGWFNSFEDCIKTFVEYTQPVSPIAQNVQEYQEIYKQYQQVYSATQAICHNTQNIGQSI